MLHLLIGRSLMRWLEKLNSEPVPVRTTDSNSADEPALLDSDTFSTHETLSAAEMHFPVVKRRAMGSEFEVYLAGTDREGLLAAGEEALNEVERLDRQLSHYRDDSDISRLNQNAAAQWVRLEPVLYQLLKRCFDLTMETDGAFDITAGPLIKAWGFFRGDFRVPSDEEIQVILDKVGAYRILFDDEDHLVYFTAPGLEINLGAVGKGFAMDAAARTLNFFGVENAVIHGGQSTIYALGQPPSGESAESPETDEPSSAVPSIANHPHPQGWPFQIKDPRDHETVLETVFLHNEAISTSGSYEQFFEVDGVRFSHILDPRTGRPTTGMLSVSVICPSAADSDALSTALFVMGPAAAEEYCKSHPNMRVIMVEEAPEESISIKRFGFEETSQPPESNLSESNISA